MLCKEDGGDEMYHAQELLMKAKMKLHMLLSMHLTLVMVMELLPATANARPIRKKRVPPCWPIRWKLQSEMRKGEINYGSV